MNESERPEEVAPARALMRTLVLVRVQLIAVTVVVAAVTLTVAMEEAVRYALMNRPEQVAAIAVSLFLACAFVRIAAEASVASSRTPWSTMRGMGAFIARHMPTVLALTLLLAVVGTTLEIWGANTFLDAREARPSEFPALAAAFIFAVAGLASFVVPRLRLLLPTPAKTDTTLRPSLRLALAPWLFATFLLGAALAATLTLLLAGALDAALRAMLSTEAYDELSTARQYLTLGLLIIGGLGSLPILNRFLDLLNHCIFFGARQPESSWFAWAIYRFPLSPISLLSTFVIIPIVSLLTTDTAMNAAPYPLAAALLPIGYLRLPIRAQTTQPFLGFRSTRETLGKISKIPSSRQLELAIVLLVSPLLCLPFFDTSNFTIALELGPLAVLLIWCAAASGVFFLVAAFGNVTGFPTLSALFVWAVLLSVLGVNDNHDVRNAGTLPDCAFVDKRDPSYARFAGEPCIALEGTGDEQVGGKFDVVRWLETRRDISLYEHYPIFIVATEGGGLRAAQFTASVLAGIQDRCPAFAEHVLAVSGVSGGSLGATVFAASAAATSSANWPRHEGAINVATYSPDGKKIATASVDRSATIWDAETGVALVKMAHEEPVTSISFSSDGAKVVTGSTDRLARVWDVATGKLLATLSGHNNTVWFASFSPDGKLIVTASADGTARLSNALDGRHIATLTGHTAAVWTAMFSPDGSKVLTASDDRTARLWSVQGNQEIGRLVGHNGVVFSAAFSPDGSKIVTASSDKTVRIWSEAGRELLRTIEGHSEGVLWATFSPDGTKIATASADKSARVWEVSTGLPLLQLVGHDNNLYSVEFSPDGGRIVTGSQDHTARTWSASTGADISAPQCSFAAYPASKTLSEVADHALSRDFLSPLLGGMLFPDAMQRVVPVPIADWDRARVLERSFEQSWDEATAAPAKSNSAWTKARISEPLLSLANERYTGGGAPDLFLNTTEVETGRSRAIGTRRLPYLLGADAVNRLGDRPAFARQQQYYTLNDQSPDMSRVSASTAAVLSARFPYLTPAGKLTTLSGWQRRYVDGGYFENSGAWVVRNILQGIAKQLGPTGKNSPGYERLRQARVHILLIQSAPDDPAEQCAMAIPRVSLKRKTAYSNDRKSVTAVASSNADSETCSWSQFRTSVVSEILSPLRALLNARSARSGITKSELLDLTEALNPLLEPIVQSDSFVSLEALNFTGASESDVPLTWVLSQRAHDLVKGSIDRQIGAAVTAMEERKPRGDQMKVGRVVVAEHRGAVSFAAPSADGTKIVTASEDGTAQIWDLRTEKRIATLIGHTKAVLFAGFSPDNSRVITTSADRTARLWTPEGATVATLEGHTSPVTDAVFSSDGSKVATVSAEGEPAMLWDAKTGALISPLATENVKNFAPQAASMPGDTPKVVNLSPAPKSARTSEKRVVTAVFSYDGSKIMTIAKTTRVWNATSGALIEDLPGHKGEVLAAVSTPKDPKGKLATNTGNGAQIWSVGDRSRSVSLAVKGSLKRAAFSPDGLMVATVSSSPGGDIAQLWNASTGQLIAALSGHDDNINSVAFSTYGNWVVSTGDDATARIWSTKDGALLASVLGHDNAVKTASFGKEGDWLVTSSTDGSARATELLTGRPLAEHLREQERNAPLRRIFCALHARKRSVATETGSSLKEQLTTKPLSASGAAPPITQAHTTPIDELEESLCKSPEGRSSPSPGQGPVAWSN